MTENAQAGVPVLHPLRDGDARNSDAYWCGYLAGTLRQIANREILTTVEGIRSIAAEVLAEYDQRPGHLPPDAVPVDRFGIGSLPPVELLLPGERIVNGNLYYSAAWL